jgi:hypothetical protein
MKHLNLWTLVAAMVAAVTLGSGCLVVSGGDDGECYEYEVCETYCDQFECWEECWWEEAESCNNPVGGDQACASDVECSEGLVCVNNLCQRRSTDDQGQAGLCQACESNADCVGEDAKCLLLNESGGSAELVCGRSCSSNADCPGGFECLQLDANNSQCLPEKNGDGVRTCGTTPDLECTTAQDCAAGESCVNNECEPPEGSECQVDADCGAGDVCRSFDCVAETEPECTDRSDCASGEVCLDGSCEAGTESCVFSSECSDDGKCINGQCQSVCSSDADCATNESCRNGVCRVLECRRTADCPAGDVCVDSSCASTCNADSECDAGYVCDERGFCKEDPNVQCRTNAECSRDEICVEGNCQMPCTCNQDCPQGDVCNLDSGLCEDAPSDAPDSCEDSCDCPSGLSCNDGTCE